MASPTPLTRCPIGGEGTRAHLHTGGRTVENVLPYVHLYQNEHLWTIALIYMAPEHGRLGSRVNLYILQNNYV